MRQINWLDSAVNELKHLRSFLAEKNPHAAQKVVKLIKESIQNLQQHPQRGKPAGDLIEYRDLIIRFGAGGYTLRYRVKDDTIYIVNLRHYRESSFHSLKEMPMLERESD